jgi:putative ABC transport system permease protein
VSWWTPWRSRAEDAELDAELRFHMDRQLQDYVQSGLSQDEARRRVRHEFGGLDQTKEDCRDVRPFHWVDEFVRDVRVGFRSLMHDRFFAVSVIAILTVGIGASVMMFSVLNAVVLRPLPYARPGELARLDTHLILQNRFDGSSPGNFYDWRGQSRTFANMTFHRRTSVTQVTFAGVDAPQRAQEGIVGPDFFELIGTPPLAGRTFSAAEYDHESRVVILSEGLWREQFGGSPSALGRTLQIDGRDHVIVGVMPRTFHLPTADTRFWRPYSVLPEWPKVKSVRDSDQIEVIGRLAPGVAVKDAEAEMAVIAARLREAHAVNVNVDIRIVPLLDYVIGPRARRGVWLGFAAVLSLLAIACANVGGLLMVRAATRRREFAVRSALGAGRARLIRQLLAEGVALWAVASVASALLAQGLIQLLRVYGPRALPRIDETTLDLPSLAFTFAGGFLVVLLCGMIPALLAAKRDITSTFATRDRSSLPRHWLQDALVSVQMAGALILLVGAVLFAQSFMRAQGEDPGYPADHLLVARIELPITKYPDRPARARFFREAATRIMALPGVLAVGGITDFFLRRNGDQWVTIEGRPAGREAGAPKLAIEGVTPGFFGAAGIDVIEGRDFADADHELSAPSTFIVSESLARRFWPGESAVGKAIVGGETVPKDGRWGTVIGVAKDIRREGRDVSPILLAYIPAFPRPFDMTVRTSTGFDTLIPLVRREIRAVDGSIPVPPVFAVDARLSERLGGRRFETQVLTAFAAIALLLSAAGLYASLAYQVTLRTREIGVRSALGADRLMIMGMVLRKGLRLAVVGAALGLVGAAWIAEALQSLLYETPALHPATFVAVAAFLLIVAATAAAAPALRAASVSPMTALREQ